MEGIDFSVMGSPEVLTADVPAPEVEAPEISEQVTESPEEETVETETAEGETEETVETKPADLRKATLDYLKSLKAQEGSDPKIIKELRERFMREQAYGEIGDIHSLRGLKAQIDAIGGAEGLADLQSTVASIEDTDALLDAGDPQVLEQIFEDSKEGAIKLAPHYLAKVQKTDPEAYERMILPHIVNKLGAANFPGVVDYLLRKTAADPETQNVLNQMKSWYEDNKRLAEGFKTDTISPERDKLKQERETLNQEREKIFMESIQGDVLSHTNQEISSRLRPFQNALKSMSEFQRRDIGNAIYSEIERAIDSDRAFSNQLKAMKSSRNRDRSGVVRLINSKISAIADAAVTRIISGYGLKAGVVTKPALKTSSNGSNGNTPIRVKVRPDDSNIDLEKTTENMLYRGMGYLKDGRLVKWR